MRRGPPRVLRCGKGVSRYVPAGGPRAKPAPAAVDLLDRVGRDDATPPCEPAGADGERVGRFRRRAVHRALDPADEATPRVCDEEAGRPAEVDGQGTHRREPIPRLRGISLTWS